MATGTVAMGTASGGAPSGGKPFGEGGGTTTGAGGGATATGGYNTSGSGTSAKLRRQLSVQPGKRAKNVSANNMALNKNIDMRKPEGREGTGEKDGGKDIIHDKPHKREIKKRERKKKATFGGEMRGGGWVGK